MNNIFYSILSLGISLFFLGVAISIGNVDSFIVDFSVMNDQELSVFQFVSFVFFIAFMYLMVVINVE